MSPLQTINVDSQDISLIFGEQKNLPIDNNLKWVPDGHISVLRDDSGNLRMWLTAARDSHVLTGASLDTLELQYPQKVLSPDKDESDRGYNGYRGFGSVIPGTGRNEGTLIGFYHNEWHPDDKNQRPFTAAVGVAQSEDNGITWLSIGSIIELPLMTRPVRSEKHRTYGAGQPSAIRIRDEDNEYVYVYHTQWSGDGPDSITVSRALVDDVLDPTSWKTFSGVTSFGLPALGNKGAPIISPQGSDRYAALPGVSFNTTLGKYVMTYETNTGFSLTTSDDGLIWNPSHQIAKFPQPQSVRKPGDTWFSYPTLLSEESDQLIGSNAFLYFSQELIDENSYHAMARVPVQISLKQHEEPRLK